MVDQLLDNGVLASGEPRHWSSWEFPGVPKLNHPESADLGRNIYRRQRSFASKICEPRKLLKLLNGTRSR